MAITTQMRTEVSQLYVALFGRAPDGEGLGFWVQLRDQGQSLEQIANTMYATTPARTYYPSFLTNQEIIASFYSNVLGRAADADGLAFWTSKLNAAGATPGSVIAEMINIVSNYTALGGTDPAGVTSSQLFNNRVAVAQYYGEKNGTVSGATAVLTSVTADAATVTAAQAAIDAGTVGGVNQGQTFTMTTGLDVLTGTAGNDTFVGSFTAGGLTETANLGDTINGGAGTDTLRISSSNGNINLPDITGVEILNIVTGGAHVSRDVSTITGLSKLVLENGTANAITATLASGQTLTLDGVTDATAGADGDALSITTNSAAVTSLNLELDGVGAQTTPDGLNDLDLDVTATGATTLNINSAGTNNISLANTGAALATLNITGSGALTVSGTTGAAITTVNAANATGGVTLDLSASTGANQTITGGSGADTFTVDLARNISINTGAGNDVVVLANPAAANLSSTTGAADAINGGDGTDTLSLTAAGAVALAGDAAADRAVITGFERVRTTTDLNASTFTLANLSGANYLQIDAATTTGAANINGLSSGATIEYRAAADSTAAVNANITGATNAGTPNDTLNVVLNSNLVNQAAAADAFELQLGVAGINKLNVSAADRVNTDAATSRDDGYILTLSNDNNVDTLTVTGSSELSFTSTASTAALQTVDASGSTGDLILNLAVNSLTQGVTVTGSGGVNTITGTGFGDIITGGARADVITAGGGADQLTGGAGADVFVFAAADFTAATAAALAAAADSISDFAKGSDIIRWGANLSVVQNGTAIGGQAAINAEGVAQFAAADDTLAERVTAVEAGINAGGAAASGQMAVFEFGSDSYVFISNGTDGIQAGDALIKLTGVTGLADSTITTTDVTIA